MAEEEIIVHSGVSWLHDHMREKLEDRAQGLLEYIGKGVPDSEYRQMVGKYHECMRQQGELAVLFSEFYQAEEIEDDELGEIDDE